MDRKEAIVREQYEKMFQIGKYDKSVNRSMIFQYVAPAMEQYAKEEKINLIWEMINENQSADEGTYTKNDIEVDLYAWLEKIDPKSQSPNNNLNT